MNIKNYTEGIISHDENLVLTDWGKATVILILVFVSLLSGKVQAQESDPQKPSITGKDSSGYHHIIIIINTEAGKKNLVV